MARRGTGIISVLITGDAKPFNRALGDVDNRLASFGKAAGLAVAAAGAAVTAFAVKIGKDAVGAASDLAESVNAVNVAFGDAAQGVLKLGETSATQMGVSQRDFNAAAVRFSAFADRIVGDGGNVAEFVGDISVRAADFASVFNIEVSEALQVFQSGLAGEAEPLKRFGINLLQAEVQTYALEAGIIAAGETMTEQQKVQARYGLLMQETAKTAGDFANTSDGLANSQRILRARLDDTSARLGGALLPAMTNIAGTIGEKLVPMFETFAQWFEDNEPAITAFIENVFDRIVTTVGNVIRAFREWYQEHGPKVVTSFTNIFAPVKDIWDSLTNIVTGIGDLISKFRDGEGDTNMFAALLSWIGDSVTRIADFISYVTAEIDLMIQALNRFADSPGVKAFERMVELARELGLVDVFKNIFSSTIPGQVVGFEQFLSRREAERRTAEAVAGQRVDAGGRVGNVTVNVTSADPQAVVDAIRSYTRMNGPLGQAVVV